VSLSLLQDILDYTGKKNFAFPIISDPKRELAVQLGMVDPDEKDAAGLPLTCRAVSTGTFVRGGYSSAGHCGSGRK